MKRNYITCTFI